MNAPPRPETADTIVALATPSGPGALGTVRLSGPRACALARCLFRPAREQADFPPARQAVFGTALAAPSADGGQDGSGQGDGSAAETLDRGVLLFFPAAASPTGEDLVEITLHGSPVVLALFMDAAQRAGARPARPGEFSFRSWLHGRLDLAQAEAVDDMIHARTAHQVRTAHRQQCGALARAVEPARSALVEWLARLEGSIEFSATEDEDFLARPALAAGLSTVRALLADLLGQAAQGLTLARGVRVVLAGPVNAGKSSLFNAWLERDRAIVSSQPGTTRDVLEAEVSWEGLPVTLIDTAGERPAGGIGASADADAPAPADAVEQEGQRRGVAERLEADLVIWLQDGSTSPRSLPPPGPGEAPRLVASSKADLAIGEAGKAPAAEHGVSFSSRTGAGLEALKKAALARLAPGWDHRERPLVTRLRQKGCLQRAAAALSEAEVLVGSGAGEELIVVPLGRVLEELAALTGRGDLEEVYDRIFSTFCIGK